MFIHLSPQFFNRLLCFISFFVTFSPSLWANEQLDPEALLNRIKALEEKQKPLLSDLKKSAV